jgi:hypothetical protein
MSTEISTVQPRGLALDTFEDAFRFSKLVATSLTLHQRTFAASRKSCLLAIQHGAELGLSPMQSLQCDCRGQRPAERLRRHGLGAVCKGVCRSASGSARRSSGEGEQMVAVMPSLSVAATLSRSTASFWLLLTPRRPACGAKARPVDAVSTSDAADACSRLCVA